MATLRRNESAYRDVRAYSFDSVGDEEDDAVAGVELARLKTLAVLSPEQAGALELEDVSDALCRSALLSIIKHVTSDAHAQLKALRLLETFLVVDLIENASLFTSEDTALLLNVFVNANHSRVRQESLVVCGMSALSGVVESRVLSDFVEACVGNLQSNGYVPATVHALSLFLISDENRRIFLDCPVGLKSVFSNLSGIGDTSEQVTYNRLLVAWSLSLSVSWRDEVARDEFVRDGDLLRSLVAVVKDHTREKIVRVAIALIARVLALAGDDGRNHAPDEGTPERNKCCEMLMCVGAVRVITNKLEDNRLKDPEMLVDLRYVDDLLKSSFRELDTMERYETELLSGRLEWGTTHALKFWSSNAKKFERSEFELLRALVDLLKTSNDETTLCVACSDLGAFVQFYPGQGRSVCNSIGAKNAVLLLLSNASSEVQRFALEACSKMMVSNWAALK